MPHSTIPKDSLSPADILEQITQHPVAILNQHRVFAIPTGWQQAWLQQQSYPRVENVAQLRAALAAKTLIICITPDAAMTKRVLENCLLQTPSSPARTLLWEETASIAHPNAPA